LWQQQTTTKWHAKVQALLQASVSIVVKLVSWDSNQLVALTMRLISSSIWRSNSWAEMAGDFFDCLEADFLSLFLLFPFGELMKII